MYQLNSSKGVIPTKVHSSYARPMRRKFFRADSDGLFRNRENPPRAKDWNAFSPSLKLMGRIRRNNFKFFVIAVMLHVIEWS